jgi:KipI family sensor histidine kinase inhibitor
VTPHGPWLPVGERALLAECDGPAAAAALARRLRSVPGVGEVVPAARTVLVVLDDAAAVARLDVCTDLATGTDLPAHGSVVIDVVYDGADLADVAQHLGTSVDAVVARHVEERWTSAFIGFAPGFAYLLGRDPTPEIPRRSSPRTRVPAGSVAVAGPYSAVYPTASPGGWQLLGRTRSAVWDADRDPPALLAPGTEVRFRAVRELVRLDDVRRDPPARAEGRAAARGGTTHDGTAAVEVVDPGPQAVVEDLGRPGLLHLGVPRGGALDRGALVRANRLVGNGRGAAALEVVMGGLVLRAWGDLVAAVTGARAPLTVQDADGTVLSHPAPDAPFCLPDRTTLVLGVPPTGTRSYVAVRGGIDAPVVLGSRSTDLLSGLGSPLAAGEVIGVRPPAGEAVGYPDPWPAPDRRISTVRVTEGPRAGRVVDRSRVLGPWTVLPSSNRVGLRLEGDPLRLHDAAELPSEGAVPGAVQVPPSGLPVVFLADHPVTGGYPVVAVVVPEDLDLLAQVRPGEQVQLVLVDGSLAARLRGAGRAGGVGS